MKSPLVSANSFLRKKDGTRRSHLNETRHNQQNRQQKQKQHKRTGNIEQAFEDERPSVTMLTRERKIRIGIKLFSRSPFVTYPENVGIVADCNTVLSAQGRDRRRLRMMGTEWKIDRNFIYDIVAKKSGKAFKSTDECFSRAVKVAEAAPLLIHKTEVAVTPFRFRTQTPRKLHGSGIGAKN